MRTSVDCLPCMLHQALTISRLSGSSEEMQLKVARKVAAGLSQVDMEKTPVENCMHVYRLITELSGKADPYVDIKKRLNDEVLKVLPLLKKKVARADVPLISALRLSLLGNVAPGVGGRLLDPDEIIKQSKLLGPVVDNLRSLLERISSLGRGAKILYLADNAGEIVYDSLVVECLVEQGLNVTVAVKETPVVTDALVEDACISGLDKIARVVTNGTACSGTPLGQCSKDFIEIFEGADLIISKGQGNFGTLTQQNKEIFFIFTIKCHVVGALLKKLIGNDTDAKRRDPYKPGDMVIYQSKGNTQS